MDFNENDKIRQKNEIDAIKSIYDTFKILIFPYKNETFIQAQIPMTINKPLTMEYYENEGDECEWKTSITDLPPLWFGIFLPFNYPSQSKPTVNLGSEWLTPHEVAFLIEKLDHLWEENFASEILFTWINYLENIAIEDLFPDNILKIIDDSISTELAKQRIKKAENKAIDQNFCQILSVENGEIIKCIPEIEKDLFEARAADLSFSRSNYLPKYLSNYNFKQELKRYRKSLHECLICLDLISGSESKLIKACRHNFCNNCIKTYVNPLILDGHLKFVCPANCNEYIYFEEIQDILEEPMRSRWNESQAVMISVGQNFNNKYIVCPREHCQSSLAYYENDLSLIFCPVCLIYSCGLCRRVSHGEEPCINIAVLKRRGLAMKYLNPSKKEKEELEKKYGPLYLKKIVEELQCENWINENSRPCPYCKMPIEKNEGCNKMICSYCWTIFCWICMSIIDPLLKNGPYSHFGGKCKLFDIPPDE